MNISINLAQDIYPVSELSLQAKQLIEKAQTTKRPLILTEDGRSVVALLDIGEFQALQEQLQWLWDWLDITQAEHGPFLPHEEVKNRYTWLLGGVADVTTN